MSRARRGRPNPHLARRAADRSGRAGLPDPTDTLDALWGPDPGTERLDAGHTQLLDPTGTHWTGDAGPGTGTHWTGDPGPGTGTHWTGDAGPGTGTTQLLDPTDPLDATWGPDPGRPDSVPTRRTRPPEPTDTLHAIWDLHDGTAPLGAGGASHRRRARPPPSRRHRPLAGRNRPVRETRLAVVGRGLGWTLAAGLGLAVAWLVLVALRHDPPAASRDAVTARLAAAVAETLATHHMLSVATWAGYATTTLVLGGLVYERFVAPRSGRLPLGAAVALGLGAAAAALPLRAAEISGDGLTAIAEPEVFHHVVASTFGGAVVLRAGGLLVLAASLGGRRRPGILPAAARAGGGAILVASYLVIGHPQASDPVTVEVAALTVHLVATATWFGGVAVLASELAPAGRFRRPLPAAAVGRFSRMAEVMVVLVLVSGLVLAEGQGALTTAPWRTGYGLALTVKLGFVAVVLAIGGYNRQRVVPAVARHDDAAARRHLRTTCVVEALVISMGVLVMTAAMTSGGF